MSEISSHERLVLLALRADPSGLTHSQLASRCVSKLEALKRAFHVVEATYTYYVAPPSLTGPLLPDWQGWLEFYCEAQPQYEQGDTLATMYACYGVVLLAAILGGTRDSERISRATTLPLPFVTLVLGMGSKRNVWDVDSVFQLQQRLSDGGADLGEIEKDLHWVKEELWEFCWTARIEARLHEFRSGHQFGGRTDTWIAAEVDGVSGASTIQ